MEQKIALVVGATGLIGKECMYCLLNDEHYGKVIALVRKPMAIKHNKLEQVVVNFDSLETYLINIKVNHVYCCLGTTMRTAGSKAAFKKVDYEYPVTIARLAKNNGAEKFILVSSLGANANSTNFYLKTKGETEDAIDKLNFDSFIIMRPSMLLGNRTEFRLGELIGKKIMRGFSFLFLGPLKKYKAIDAWKVAKAMVMLTTGNNKGKNIIESDKIQTIVG